jgi:Protein of unknown function (DUF3102)
MNMMIPHARRATASVPVGATLVEHARDGVVVVAVVRGGSLSVHGNAPVCLVPAPEQAASRVPTTTTSNRAGGEHVLVLLINKPDETVRHIAARRGTRGRSNRRNLSYEQKAMAAAYKEQVEDIALNFRRESGSKGGRGKKKNREANSPHGLPDRADQTRTKAGKRFGVGEKAVDTASKIRKQGVPELAAPFDYQSLDAETRIVVQQKTSEIRTLMRRAAQDIVDIGLRLIEVKARLPHGQFLPWLEAEFQWHRDTANKFMNVAEQFGGCEMSKISTFAPSALYLLSAPSTPESARVEAMDRATAGEPISPMFGKGVHTVHTLHPRC